MDASITVPGCLKKKSRGHEEDLAKHPKENKRHNVAPQPLHLGWILNIRRIEIWVSLKYFGIQPNIHIKKRQRRSICKPVPVHLTVQISPSLQCGLSYRPMQHLHEFRDIIEVHFQKRRGLTYAKSPSKSDNSPPKVIIIPKTDQSILCQLSHFHTFCHQIGG